MTEHTPESEDATCGDCWITPDPSSDSIPLKVIVKPCPFHRQAKALSEALLEALPDIDLLKRAAEALAYHGIGPASDVEKLRVAAHRFEAAIDGRHEGGVQCS